MSGDEIREVIRDVFGRGFQTEEINGWVSMRCPLSTWTHSRGKDSNPSAGVSINPSGMSVFNCFTCKNKAPFHGMLRKYANFSGEDLDDLIEELDAEAYLGARSLATWEEAKSKNTAEPLAVLDKAIYLDLYDPAAGHPYLAERGISDETADKLQLMVDPCDPADGEERILFPVFGPEGDLHGFTGRATNPGARLKVRDYHGLSKARCLLGAHLVERENPRYVLVVEGLFDYANAWNCGYPAVAVMHSTMTQFQADIMRGFSLPTYLFYDNDEAGQAGVQEAGRLLSRYQPVMKVRYPEMWIETSPTEGHWLKDPGELLAEEFQGMIDDSRMF